MRLIKTIHYVIIPAIVFGVAWVGTFFTRQGITWYQTLSLPWWTPPDRIIQGAWTTIFILIAVSLIMLWNRRTDEHCHCAIFNVFVANGIFNVVWSALFFVLHDVGVAVLVALLLALSAYALIILLRPISRTASWLLAPYALWATFATYLNYVIWQMN